jgi:hypothetical protein
VNGLLNGTARFYKPRKNRFFEGKNGSLPGEFPIIFKIAYSWKSGK